MNKKNETKVKRSRKIPAVMSAADITSTVSGDGAVVHELVCPANCGIKKVSLASGYLRPGQAAAAHYHKRSEEIYYILFGTGLARVGNSAFEIKEGDAVFIPPGAIHCLENLNPNEPLRVLAVSSPPFGEEDMLFVS